jgi:pimeloyl-ACP methyl ester carboxylesterase
MPSITLNDQRLHYAAHRDDPHTPPTPLVLVHGAGGNLYHWPPGLRRLPGHDVYALDLPGHGKSEGPGRDSIDGYVQVVYDWARALDLPPFVIAGHSMGGAIAQTFALKHPEMLKGMILVATGARLRVHPKILDGIRTDMNAVVEMLMDWAYGQKATPEQKRQFLKQFNSVDQDVMYGDWAACDVFDVRDQLPNIDIPTLVISGSMDVMTPEKYGRYMAENLPNADFALIEGGGHMLMIEQPQMVINAIRGFLDQLQL